MDKHLEIIENKINKNDEEIKEIAFKICRNYNSPFSYLWKVNFDKLENENKLLKELLEGLRDV